MRRTKALLLTLVGATIVVGAAAVAAHALFYPTALRGFGEVTPDGRVAGWVVDADDPTHRVEVELYVDGRFVAAGAAELPRPDVVEAGRALDARCGYSFQLPPLAPGEHEARVYAAHPVAGGAYRTLRQTGGALRFSTGAPAR